MTADQPLDLTLLAELDGGLLDAQRAREVRAAALADPRSAATLGALAAVRAELAAYAAPPVPADVAMRWAAAVGATAADRTAAAPAGDTIGQHHSGPDRTGPHPTGRHSAKRRAAGQHPATRDLPEPNTTAPDPAFARQPARPASECPARRPPDGRPPKRRARSRPAADLSRWRRPRLVVAVIVLALSVLTVEGLHRARPPEQAPVLSVSSVELAATGRAAFGVADLGDLADPVHRAECLRSVTPPGVTPDDRLLGGRQVLLDGRPGVLMVLATGALGSFRVVVVDPDCGPDGGTLLASARVGP